MATQEKLSEYGSVLVKPTRDFDAGSRVTITLTYTVGAKAIAEGGGIVLGFPETWEAPIAPLLYTVPWQPKVGDAPQDRIRTYSPRNIAVELETEGLAVPRLLAEQHWARVVVAQGALAPGEKIIFVYGDKTWGSEGAFVGNAPRDDQAIRVFVDVGGNGDYKEVQNSPIKVKVVAGSASRLYVAAPSILASDQKFTVRIAVTDERRNRPRSVVRCHLTGKPVVVVKKGRGRKSRILFRQELKEANNNSKVFRNVTLDGEGILKVAVSDESGDIFGLSNPILLGEALEDLDAPRSAQAAAVPPPAKAKAPEADARPAEAKAVPKPEEAAPAVQAVEPAPAAPEPAKPEAEPSWQIFWGDIHGKTQFTPNARKTSPDQYYSYGKEMGLLDFCAITDEGAGFRDEPWAAAQEAARKFYAPGEFVTFRAFEWASSVYGHRSVYFADDVIEGKLDDEGNLDWLDINHFYAMLRERNVLIVPQNTFVWTDWGFHDPAHERVVEIYSSWGAAERHGNPMWKHSEIPGGGVQSALARGYRLGIIASSDTDHGMPGRSYPSHCDLKPFKGGLAAVYAKELTREAVFEALKQRRCYATTGARIIVTFSVNGHPMGSEIEVPWESYEEPRRLKIRVAGTDAIQEVVIVRNNEDIYRVNECGDFIEFEYEDDESMREALTDAEEREVGAGSLYYYVRVTQRDGEMAWCSPVWVILGNPPEPGRIQK